MKADGTAPPSCCGTSGRTVAAQAAPGAQRDGSLSRGNPRISQRMAMSPKKVTWGDKPGSAQRGRRPTPLDPCRTEPQADFNIPSTLQIHQRIDQPPALGAIRVPKRTSGQKTNRDAKIMQQSRRGHAATPVVLSAHPQPNPPKPTHPKAREEAERNNPREHSQGPRQHLIREPRTSRPQPFHATSMSLSVAMMLAS